MKNLALIKNFYILNYINMTKTKTTKIYIKKQTKYINIYIYIHV